ncbi:uncharacterized protein K452DRAFT_332676 [Aplosporella prunicola CBS 121167]|uniref:Retrovirus-related Pol polyprotein from transposon TNT 1-94-like beta-barrel domain-containing protein n=1 Tax=Aplosporella prunicola CBS 121167 TaxID=1176127 RepID=A0A6A6BFE1_9PEZI|nr:uncharacterized protein K452DRAFT_332676 [Aplosporella prunicola CBS 121167]KAF2141954.1 hypothetical protein K452DRAFT_332676 [Aplosporella prunicola CBS 121167]
MRAATSSGRDHQAPKKHFQRERIMEEEISLNPRAWVGLSTLNYHICNDRSYFTTYNPIGSLPVHFCGAAETLRDENLGISTAHGIGDVALQICKSNGELTTLILNEVLYVPGSPCNAIAVLNLGKCFRFDRGAGVVYDGKDREVAYLPRQGRALVTLKLANEWSGMFPETVKDKDAPLVSLGYWAMGAPVLNETDTVKEVLQNVMQLTDYAEDGRFGMDVYPRIHAGKYLDQKVNLTIGKVLELLALYDKSDKTKEKFINSGLLKPDFSESKLTYGTSNLDKKRAGGIIPETDRFAYPEPSHRSLNQWNPPSPQTPIQNVPSLKATSPEIPKQEASDLNVPAPNAFGLTPSIPQRHTLEILSKTKFIQLGWGSRAGFQHAHALMHPADIVAGNRILDEYERQEIGLGWFHSHGYLLRRHEYRGGREWTVATAYSK